MRKHYTAEQRTALIEMVVTGRAKLQTAAVQLGVAESTAYYWVKCAQRRTSRTIAPGEKSRRSSEEKVASPTFARLVRTTTTPSAITLRMAGVVIEVHSGFDPVLLRDVVAALTERVA